MRVSRVLQATLAFVVTTLGYGAMRTAQRSQLGGGVNGEAAGGSGLEQLGPAGGGSDDGIAALDKEL